MTARTTMAVRWFLLLSLLPLHSAKSQEGTQPKPGSQSPRCTSCPQPEYPDKAPKAKSAGTVVVLEVTVTTEGRIIDARVVKGPGMGPEQKALSAVKKWKFKPAIGPNGRPVACRIQIEVTLPPDTGV